MSDRVWLFIPCYVDQLMPEIGMAMVEVLERLGVSLEYPGRQTCCGQPALNSGYEAEAACVARRMIELFAPAVASGARVVVPSGSCAAMVKIFVPKLLEGTADHAAAVALADATWEFSDYLVNVLGVDEEAVAGRLGAVFPHKVTIHDGCHGLRELGISGAPRTLLRGVRGLEIVEMGEAKTCCGFGGTFAVKYAQVSVAMAEVKCKSAVETGARYIVSTDPSCLMQIRGYTQRQGMAVSTLHIAQVLACRVGGPAGTPGVVMTAPAAGTARTIPLRQFKADADVATADGDRRGFVRKALGGYVVTRGGTQGGFADYEKARELAAGIKWNAIENLEAMLVEFEAKLLARGVRVHWAADGESARQYVLKVLKEKDARRVIKSKTMTSEEIHLNDAMQAAGYEVVESDLGEYIQQLRGEAPYHFVFPSMHLKRGEIRETFEKEIGGMTSDDPQYLTMTARKVMREKYLRADVGISGANFGVADTGMIAITENEGNARLSCAMPRVHIALMGIEKVIPTLADLALLQPMLGTAGTGQLMTCYNSLYGGGRMPGEVDGPEEMHLVLLDNNRTQMLADPHLRDALRCIRCGACLNVCPIFKNVGGFTYGTTYQGPIGSVITPPLRGVDDFGHLAFASSLCGACTETCPVKIDLHHHLLYIRSRAVARGRGLAERLMMKAFAFGMARPRLYRTGARIGLTLDGMVKFIRGTVLDPLGAWRRSRTLPEKPPQSFSRWWASRHKDGK